MPFKKIVVGLTVITRSYILLVRNIIDVPMMMIADDKNDA